MADPPPCICWDNLQLNAITRPSEPVRPSVAAAAAEADERLRWNSFAPVVSPYNGSCSLGYLP
jgi:hypothetical protein